MPTVPPPVPRLGRSRPVIDRCGWTRLYWVQELEDGATVSGWTRTRFGAQWAANRAYHDPPSLLVPSIDDLLGPSSDIMV